MTTIRIDEVQSEGQYLDVCWSDGGHSRFHYMWLRDNCSCPQCGNKSGGHRYLSLGDIPVSIKPDSFNLDSNDELVLVWPDDRHETRYTPGWLRAHSCLQHRETSKGGGPRLWDTTIEKELRRWNYFEVMGDDSARKDMYESLRDNGFVLLREVPATPDGIELLAGLFGFIRQTHYGRIFDLISTKDKRILANTSHTIKPHHDELFRDPTPGLLMMHCLKPSDDDGGASILVDGFNAAGILSERDPEAFELLTRAPIGHQRFLVDASDDVALSAKWRTIELDFDGALKAVRLNERTMAPIEASENEMEAIYSALQELFALVYDPANWLQVRLEEGDAVVLDNHRVLHARTSFSGARHLRQCHVDRDEFFSRLRALTRRLNPRSDESIRTEYVQ